MGPISFISYLTDTEIHRVKDLRKHASECGVTGNELTRFDEIIDAIIVRKVKTVKIIEEALK